MKIKNYVFGGVAVAIMVSAGITSANALDLPSTKYVNDVVEAVDNKIGTLTDLTTSTKSSTVAAINEVKGEVSKVSGLVAEDGGLKDGALKDGSVTHPKLANDAVEGDNIKDGSVTQGKIANGAVGADQLANEAVTEGKLSQDLQTKIGKIADIDGKEDVTNKAKAEDVASRTGSDEYYTSVAAAESLITAALNEAGLSGTGGINGSKITDGTIAEDKLDPTLKNKLAGFEKTADRISAAAAETNKSAEDKYPSMAAANALAEAAASSAVNNLTVSSEKIADNAVTEGKIQNGAVTEDKLDAGLKTKLGGYEEHKNKVISTEDMNKTSTTLYPSMLVADKLATDAAAAALASANLSGLVGTDGTIDGAKIKDGTITEAKLSEALKQTLSTLDNANCSAEGKNCVLTWTGSGFAWTDIVDAAN